jgi:hypothetical protein
MMNPEQEDDGFTGFNSYDAEFRTFRDDVYILILETMHDASKHLSARAERRLAKIEAALKQSTEEDHQQFLVDESVDIRARTNDQETFLRNMALVALASRLTHSLKTMAKAANFRPGKKRYGTKADSEFTRLWKEYNERFGIDFTANADKIAFAETLREVRNQIVHAGSEANPFLDDLTFEKYEQGEEAYLDLSFSKEFPAFVSGTGMFAQVNVSKDELQRMADASVALVDWLATHLSAQEQAWIAEATKRVS